MKESGYWERWALPLLVLTAVLLRWGTFFPSVINHDESTYFLIGKGLLAGQTYLVDSYDTKPVGIFLIYALFNGLGGGSIIAARLFATLVVGLTAFLIFRLGRRAGGSARVGWAAGVGYLFLTSIFKYYGLSPNTELFFNPCTVGAVLLVWGDGRRVRHYAAAGLLLGIGFMIKYVVAADALAVGLYLLWQGWNTDRPVSGILRACVPLTLAFVVPFVLTYLYYQSIGQVDTFLFYTFEVTGRYPVDADWATRLLFVLAFFGRFFPFTLLAIFAWRERRTEDLVWQNFLLLWLVLATVMTLLPGKTFGHYQIQLMPPLALLAATWWHGDRREQAWLRGLPARAAWAFLIVAGVGISAGLFVYYQSKLDGPRLIAAELKQRLNPGELVYTGNYHHITYALLDQAPLTPYIHSSLLFYEHHAAALEIDLGREAERILAHRPRYVLLRTEHPDNALTAALHARYRVTDTLLDKVLLLEPK